MAQIDDFFMYENRVEGITDADYQRTQPYVEAANRSATASACSVPRSFRQPCVCPCIICRALSTVSPCRTRKIMVSIAAKLRKNERNAKGKLAFLLISE